MKLPLLGGSTEEFSQDQNFERTINMYPETSNTGRSNLVLYPFPGLSTKRTSSNNLTTILKFQDDLFLAGLTGISDWYDYNSGSWSSLSARSTIRSSFYNKIKTAKLDDSFFMSPRQYIERNTSAPIDRAYNLSESPIQGDQLLSDNSFDSAAAWTAGSGWTIDTANGLAKASSATGTLDQTVTLSSNATLVVEIDIFSYTSGNLEITSTPGIGGRPRYRNINLRDEAGSYDRLDEMNSPAGDTIITTIGGQAGSYTISFGPDTYVASDVTVYISEIRMYEVGVLSSGFNITNINGYYVKDGENTGQFAVSALRDGKYWSSLDQAYMVNEGQDIQHMESNLGYLWIFGEDSIELWRPSESIDFPLEYVNTVSNGIGVLFPFSITKIKDKFVFIGNDMSLYVTSGLNIKEIDSKFLIEEILDIQKVQNALDIVLTSLSYKEHDFVFISLGPESETFVYDLTTNLWFELQNPYSPILDTITYEFNENAKDYLYYVVNNSKDLLHLDPDKYTDENGYAIVKTRQSAFIHAEGAPLYFKELVIVSDNGSHSDNITVYWSDDGGRNFSGASPSTISGEMKYRRLGRSSNGRIFKISSGADEYVPFIDIYADVEKGSKYGR